MGTLSCAALLLSLLLPSAGTTIHVPSEGFAVDLPAGARWRQIDGNGISIQIAPAEGRRAPFASSEITLVLSDFPPEAYSLQETSFARLPMRERRADGTNIQWEVASGPYPDWLEFNARLVRGERRIRIFTNYFSPSERARVERAVLGTIASLRFLPVTRRFGHPDGYSVEPPRGWIPLAWHEHNDIRFHRTVERTAAAWRPTGEEDEFGPVEEYLPAEKLWEGWIYVYDADTSIPSLDSAVADIRDHYSAGGTTYGPVRRESLPPVEVAWVEAPGAARPYIGAVRHAGRLVFVNAERRAPDPAPGAGLPGEDEIREGFLQALRSARGEK